MKKNYLAPEAIATQVAPAAMLAESGPGLSDKDSDTNQDAGAPEEKAWGEIW